MIWNEAKECMSRDEMQALQSKRLVKAVNRVYHNVEYYRKKMQAVGLMPADIKGIEDIEKAREPLYTSKPECDRSGMGFTVMESFMDAVSVHSAKGRGTLVILTKYLEKKR